MTEEAIMIRNAAGVCWLQVRGRDGSSRSSHVGQIPLEDVQGFCERHGIKFYQMRNPDRPGSFKRGADRDPVGIRNGQRVSSAPVPAPEAQRQQASL
jgi:hypothetical protein